MLYWLTSLSDGGDFFNLFRYITFRAGGAFLTALIFGFLFGKPLINVLRRKQGKGQPIRDDGPEGHFSKAGTPTMGGLLIVGALVTSTLIWARWDNPYVWMVLFVTLAYAAIGFADDYAKVSKQNTKGVSGTPDIANTILDKIRKCSAFLADLTFVGKDTVRPDDDTKFFPNPNVLLELGFAIPYLEWTRIICVMNTYYGETKDLPFDLRHRRWPISYHLPPDADEQASIIRHVIHNHIACENIIPLQGLHVPSCFQDRS